MPFYTDLQYEEKDVFKKKSHLSIEYSRGVWG